MYLSIHYSSLYFSDFNSHVENELFGQHIVSLTLPKILNDHLERKKPLLISFQGPTGCGKSFVSKMIVQSFVQDGFNNKFIKTYYGSRDFPHIKEKDNYRVSSPYLLFKITVLIAFHGFLTIGMQ